MFITSWCSNNSKGFSSFSFLVFSLKRPTPFFVFHFYCSCVQVTRVLSHFFLVWSLGLILSWCCNKLYCYFFSVSNLDFESYFCVSFSTLILCNFFCCYILKKTKRYIHIITKNTLEYYILMKQSLSKQYIQLSFFTHSGYP